MILSSDARYLDRSTSIKTPSTSEKLIVAPMEEVQSVDLEENDFEYREYYLPCFFRLG